MLLASVVFALEQPKVLPPDEAFKIQASQVADAIVIDIKLGENIYLYDDKFKISIVKPKVIFLDTVIKRPEAIVYEEYKIFNENFTLLLPLATVKRDIGGGAFTLRVEFQGCSKSGICYQPMQKDFTFTLPLSQTQAQAQAQIPSNNQVNKETSEESAIANSIATNSIWLVLLSFFGFGLLLSFTPCVFPMIPILSSIIVSQSENITTKKAFWLSSVYVLAMALAYTIAGVLAGLFGTNIQASLQNPWVISLFSFVFVALALSMFGFYKIQLPSFIQSALTKKSDQMQGQGFVSVAVMGFFSALIVGPCVAAPLAGALVYISQSGDALLGGAALFTMSLGMGVPLIAIGMSAGKFMPRPGGWMENVNKVFGVVMLAVAIWMLSRIISAQATMLLSAILVLSSSVYMGALQPLEQTVSGWKKLLKSLAIIFLLYGAALFIGVMSNAENMLAPLERFGVSVTNTGVEKKQNAFMQIANLQELEKALKNATKPVMLDFYADWCVSCVELEKFTFSDPLVQAKMQNFILLQADVTANNNAHKELLKAFGLFGPPAILFFKDAKELEAKRVIGFKNAKDFLAHLGSI
ncbi:MAG: protein-disulfide reductase DsbD [Sulfurospirillum sp.]|nr:protein-disulfide reductase DsbD [Sulfurospirillum sp.]